MIYSRQIKNRQLDITQRYRIMWLVFLASALGQLCIDLYTPSFPAMQLAFATSAQNIKLSLTYYLLGYSVTQLFYGFAADKYGRRVTLLLGYSGFLISTLFIIRSESITNLLIWRLIQGSMAAAFQVCLRSVIRDLFSGSELTRISARFSIAWSMIPILAPVLGGYIQHYFGWHMQFQIILILTAIFALISWHLFPETSQKNCLKSFPDFLQALKLHLFNRQLILFNIIVGLSTIPMMAYVATTPFLYQVNLKLSPVTFGWLAFSATLFYMLGSFLVAKIIKNTSQRLLSRMLWLNFFAAIIFLIVSLIWRHSLLAILLPNFFLLLTIGIIFPTAAGFAYQAIKQYVGVGTAVFGTVLVLCATCGMAVMAILPHHNAIPLALLVMVNSCLMLLLMTLAKRFCKFKD